MKNKVINACCLLILSTLLLSGCKSDNNSSAKQSYVIIGENIKAEAPKKMPIVNADKIPCDVRNIVNILFGENIPEKVKIDKSGSYETEDAKIRWECYDNTAEFWLDGLYNCSLEQLKDVIDKEYSLSISEEGYFTVSHNDGSLEDRDIGLSYSGVEIMGNIGFPSPYSGSGENDIRGSFVSIGISDNKINSLGFYNMLTPKNVGKERDVISIETATEKLNEYLNMIYEEQHTDIHVINIAKLIYIPLPSDKADTYELTPAWLIIMEQNGVQKRAIVDAYVGIVYDYQ